MKKFYLAVLFLFILGVSSYAQKVNGIVRGTLQDSASAIGLPDATISVVRTKDSSLISFTITSSSGFFEIKNLDAGNYTLLASFTGLQGYKKEFTIGAGHTVQDIGVVKLGRIYKTMNEVVVKDDAPVKIKGDTVEFRAESFKSVKPNATVEDLLKKIPGMEVDKEGAVKSQGETVQKVYVDGKEFFGNDPKMATRNLSQDMVESVQVFDDMSEQAKFTQMDDGSRSRTINIKLKKDKRNGVFGRAMAGGGTDDRYQSSLSLNKFNGPRQVSLVGSANNLGRQNFSFNDVAGGMGVSGIGSGGGGMVIRDGGGGGNVGGGGNNSGISSPKSIGLNYRDVWGTKVDVSGSISGSSTRTILEQSAFSSEKLPRDSSVDIDKITRSNNLNQNLRFNFRLEYKIDSMNSLLYYPSITLQNSDAYSYNNWQHYATLPGVPTYRALSQERTNLSNRDGLNMNQNLLFRHRFSKRGRTVTVGLTSALNESTGTGSVYSPYDYYSRSEMLYKSILLDQESKQEIKGFNNTISTSYTEPIGRNKMVELNYAYTDNNSTSDRKVFDIDSVSHKYEVLNAPLTNYFENDYVSHRVAANFRMQQRKYNFQLGIGEQINHLSSRSVRAATNKDSTVKQTFVNLYPTANFNYNFTRNKSLRFRYSGRTNQPGISQLQDVPDNSNPLRVRTGNPGLKQEFSNSLNLNYNTFNMVNFRFFSANVSFNQTTNKIVNSTEELPAKYATAPDTSTRGKQLIVPVNLNGAYSASGFFTLGFPFRNPKLKGSTINASTMATYNRDVSMFYKRLNYTRNLRVNQSLGINYTYKEKIDLALRANVSYNKVQYDSDLSPDVHYWSQTYSADFTFRLPKDFIFETDFDYYITTGQSQGYNRNIPLLNGGFSKLVFKNKAGQIKLDVRDIFKQNQSIYRSILNNGFEDVRSNVIQRYFMLSFTYNLNRMGGQNILRQGGRNFHGAPPPPPGY